MGVRNDLHASKAPAYGLFNGLGLRPKKPLPPPRYPPLHPGGLQVVITEQLAGNQAVRGITIGHEGTEWPVRYRSARSDQMVRGSGRRATWRVPI